MKIDPHQLIRIARSLGLDLYRDRDGSHITVHFEQDPPPELFDILRQHKARIIPLLPPEPEDDHERA